MPAGGVGRQPLVVIQLQRFQQRVFRVAPHEAAIGLGIEMSVLFDKGVILGVEPLAQGGHPAFIGVGGLFRIDEFAQSVPDLNHGNKAQTGRFILDRKNIIIVFTESGGGLEDNLPALRLDAQGVRFQGLKIRAADEIGVARPDFRVERVSLARHETVRRKLVQPRGDFLSQIRMGRIGQAGQRPLEHSPGIGQCADDLPGIFRKVAVDCGRSPVAAPGVVHINGDRVHPVPAAFVFAVMPLKKHDVGRDIGEGVLAKGCFRQADSAKQVGLPRNMLTGRGVGGIHKITADHKGRDATFAQQTDGLGKKIIVDGKLSQFREIRVVQRLFAEGGIAHYGVEKAAAESGVLKTVMYMMLIGIEILGYGGSRGIEFYGKEFRIESFRTKAQEVADPHRRFQNPERFPCIKAEAGKPLIDAFDNGFRCIVRVLC